MIGFGTRLSYAFRCFFSVLSRGEIPAEIARELINGPVQQPPAQPATAAAQPPRPQAPAVDPVDRAVQMLALLQRDGRLVDFIAEDLAPYQDAQIGAAVRDVHESCRKVF